MSKARPAAQMKECQEAIERRQGDQCFMPTCRNAWSDVAHIRAAGAGGSPDSLRPGNVMGLCRQCHQIFDGQILQGRQRMLGDLAQQWTIELERRSE